MWIMVRAGLVAATFGDCLGTLHHQAAAFFACLTRRLGFDGKLAIRVVGAGIEYAEPPAALRDVAFLALRTDYPSPFSGFFGFVFFNEFAFRITRAGDKSAGAVAPFLDDQFAAIILFLFTLL